LRDGGAGFQRSQVSVTERPGPKNKKKKALRLESWLKCEEWEKGSDRGKGGDVTFQRRRLGGDRVRGPLIKKRQISRKNNDQLPGGLYGVRGRKAPERPKCWDGLPPKRPDSHQRKRSGGRHSTEELLGKRQKGRGTHINDQGVDNVQELVSKIGQINLKSSVIKKARGGVA